MAVDVYVPTRPSNYSPAMRLNYDSPQARGLVHWFPCQFGIDAGTSMILYDNCGRANCRDGTKTGEVPPHFIIDPIMGRCLDFNQAADECLSNEDFAPYTSIFGVELSYTSWFKVNNVTGGDWSPIIWLGDDESGTKMRFCVVRDAVWSIVNRGTTQTIVDSTKTVVANQWHHGVGTIDPSTNMVSYLEGGNPGTGSGGGTNYGTVDTLYIGRLGDSSPGSSHNGQLADARVYNRVLTAGEVRAQYDPATRWELYKPRPFQFTGFVAAAGPAGGRIMSSLAGAGGLAGMGGIAGKGGGLAG